MSVESAAEINGGAVIDEFFGDAKAQALGVIGSGYQGDLSVKRFAHRAFGFGGRGFGVKRCLIRWRVRVSCLPAIGRESFWLKFSPSIGRS